MQIEIDANAFTIAMFLTKDITEARAPKEQWQETEQRVIEFYKVLTRKMRN